jgi:diguanylate cyclase (GGDEF)-like protein
MNFKRQFEGWGLASRIVALSLLLLLVVQAAVFGVVRESIDRSARLQIDQQLVVGERVWRRLLEENAQTLSQGAALVAADFGFRDAVSSGDNETIGSALQNHGNRIGATVTALLDIDMKLRVVGDGQNVLELVPTLQALWGDPSRKGNFGHFAMIKGLPHQFVLVPIKAPVVVGWVVMGFPIDQSLVNSMRSLSDLHVALVSRLPGQNAPSVLSTLSAEESLPLAAVGPGLTELPIQGDILVTRKVPLDAVGGEVNTLLLRSMNDVMAPFRQLQVSLAWVTGLGVLLFGFGSSLVTRRMTTPLRSLVGATKRLAQRDYETPVKHLHRKDEFGRLANAFDNMRINIGAQQSEIRQLAYRDRLTGLPNRALFRETVQHVIDSRTQTGAPASMPFSVLMLDLDRFKHVNDVLGYSFGDRLLKAVGQRLDEQDFGQDAMVARLGGDEFAILLAHSDAAAALGVTEGIVKSFESPLILDDQTVDLSSGIGVACWPEHAEDADSLLSRAEVAMYAAKHKTTVVQLYDAALDSSSTQTLSLLSELRHAVEHGELRLFLQPKIALDSDRVVAAEALVRWQHPERGLVPPMLFIPFAEQTGFVRQLTLWMFEEVARIWAGLQSDEQPLRIAINLSTRDLLDLEFPAKLDALLAKHQVPSSAFCLEITESAIMDDPQRAEQTLNRLSASGFKLSIDDFGTGYSSLAYLKRLPVDELKIDKSFVMGMEKDDDDAKIVRSTIDLAHNLGLSVVAEGVENALIWDKLKALSCDEAQGYFMSKPVPLSDFVAWRERWNEKHGLLMLL